MNLLRHRPLSRRTALQGIGATLSLPFLEAMLPKSALSSTEAASAAIPRRGAWFYFGTGMNMRQFEPTDEGKDFSFPRILKPLEKFRGDLTVFSGTYLEHGGGHNGEFNRFVGVACSPQGCAVAHAEAEVSSAVTCTDDV